MEFFQRDKVEQAWTEHLERMRQEVEPDLNQEAQMALDAATADDAEMAELDSYQPLPTEKKKGCMPKAQMKLFKDTVAEMGPNYTGYGTWKTLWVHRRRAPISSCRTDTVCWDGHVAKRIWAGVPKKDLDLHVVQHHGMGIPSTRLIPPQHRFLLCC